MRRVKYVAMAALGFILWSLLMKTYPEVPDNIFLLIFILGCIILITHFIRKEKDNGDWLAVQR